MTRTTRTLLFLTAFLLFLVAAPTLILYAQGWRLDWNTLQATQTGAVYVKAVPGTAMVTVRAQAPKRTSFLDGGLLVDNLIPGDYRVQVSKPEFQSWVKTLTVRTREVVEAKNIVLFPDRIEFRELVKGVSTMWPMFSENSLFLFSSEDASLSRLNLKTMERVPLLPAHVIQGAIKDIRMLPSRKELLLTIESGGKTRHAVLALPESGITECIQKLCPLFPSGETSVHAEPYPAGEYLVAIQKSIGGRLQIVNYRTHEIVYSLSKNALAFTSSGTDIVWINQGGEVLREDPSRISPVNARQMTRVSVPVSAREKVAVVLLEGSTFLTQENRALIFDESTEIFRQIFSNIDTLAASPDGKKIAVANGSELMIYYTANETGQPARREGETVFLNRFNQRPANISWITSHYLLYTVGDTVKISEIDNRDSLNNIDIARFQAPLVFFDGSQGIVYLLSGKTLYQSTPLL